MTRHEMELRAVSGHAMAMAISSLRRTAARRSFRAFAMTYLAAHFKLRPSSMHLELFQILQRAVDTRGQRIAIAAPRGHAKTTLISQAYILWCICFRFEPFILLISNTIDQASDCLSAIKHELETNALLLDDFPEVCEGAGSTHTGKRWRKEEIITRNDVKVTAFGADKKIRGRKHRENRPSLIILDDVENETEIRAPDQRAYKMEWFNKAVLKAGSSSTNVIVAGTVLHYDSLLATLLDAKKSPGWWSRKFQAVSGWASNQDLWERWMKVYSHQDVSIDDQAANVDGPRSGPELARRFFESRETRMLEGARVLWAECEDYYALMVQRLTEGRASFDSEKQNEPVNRDDCLFPEHEVRFWDDQYENEEQLIAAVQAATGYSHPRIYGACDPSMGKFGKGVGGVGGGRAGDFSAIISVLRDKGGVLYVLDADIKRCSPDALIESMLQYHKLRKYCRFAIEANQFQQFLVEETLRRGRERKVRLPAQGITHTSDKVGRIQRLQALVATGMLRFSKRHRVLLEQLQHFPMVAHDDGPDALEMAMQITERQWIFDEMKRDRWIA